MDLGTCQWEEINSPVLYKVPLGKSQMNEHNTVELNLLRQISNNFKKKKSKALLPLPMVNLQSSCIKAFLP